MKVYVRIHGVLRAYVVEEATSVEAARKAVTDHLSAQGFLRFMPVLALIK